jgi:hypothetical protein
MNPIIGVGLPKEVFTSRARWMPLIVEWNASANMFYFLKYLLLLIPLIFKLKCNNLISNEIMVWMLRMCVCMHSRFVENHPIRILEDGPLILNGGGGFCHNDYHDSFILCRGLCPIPTHSDFITFRRLENLHVAMPTKAQAHFLWCAARRSLHAFTKDSSVSV